MTESDENILVLSGAAGKEGCSSFTSVSPLWSWQVLLLVGSADRFHLLMTKIFCQLYNSCRWVLKQDYNKRSEKSKFERNMSLNPGEPLICALSSLLALRVLSTITGRHPVYLLWHLTGSFLNPPVIECLIFRSVFLYMLLLLQRKFLWLILFEFKKWIRRTCALNFRLSDESALKICTEAWIWIMFDTSVPYRSPISLCLYSKTLKLLRCLKLNQG